MSDMAKIDLNALQSGPQGQPAPQPLKEEPKAPISPPDVKEPVSATPPIKKELDSERFAQLARKERGIVAKEQKLRAQAQELARREAEIKAFMEAKSSKDYSKAAELLGISYDEWTQYILNGSKATPSLEVKEVKDEISKLKQEQEARDKANREAQKKAAEVEYRQVLSDFQSEINEYVDSNKETFELSALYGDASKPLIMEVVQQHFDRTKQILSIKEATEMVEKYFETELERVASSKKFQAKTQSPKEGQGQLKEEKGLKAPSPTLSNSMTSSAPSLVSAKTESERMTRAMAALSKAS